MSVADRIAAVKTELEGLKREIRSKQRAKEDELRWEEYGRSAGASFNFTIQRTLRGHFGKIYALDWAGHDDKTVLSASQDGKLIVWNAYTENKKQAISLKSAWVMTCAFEKESGRFVACGGLDNICSLYDVSTGTVGGVSLPHELVGHDGYLSCCKFLAPGQMLTSSGDSTCILWDCGEARSRKLATFADHSADVMSVSPHPTDKNLFVSGSCDSTAKLWDIRLGACTRTFTGHVSDVNAVEFFPSGHAIGTGSDDASCRVFDLRSCGPVCVFSEERIIAGVTDVAFSRTGRILFASYDEAFCRAWETISKEGTFHELKGHKNRVSCIGVNSTGQSLCSGSWDTELTVWC